MSPLLSIVLATTNQGKLAELRALLAGLPVELFSVSEVLGQAPEIVEDGATFEANAGLKAQAVCRLTRMLALADDSGLEVDALGGRPGVRSKRFAHEHATDAENNAALLRALELLPGAPRTARFACVLALADPFRDAALHSVRGACEGSIALEPRGHAGFGYDPLFIVDGHGGRTMAELGEGEKNAISHRGRAARALAPVLRGVLDGYLAEARRIIG